MKPYLLKIILLCIVIISGPLQAGDATYSIAGTTVENNIDQWTLSNGMKIVLKHTDFDSDEVLVGMQATGGYASLPLSKQPAAMVAPGMVLASNFTSFVSNMLSDEDMDFDVGIMPYFRGLQGYCIPADIETLLETINNLFSYQQLDIDVFNRVIETLRTQLQMKKYDSDDDFPNNVNSINNLNVNLVQKLTLQDLEKVNLQQCQELFNDFFADPQDFVVVIVGNFDAKNLRMAIDKYLAAIPKRKSEIHFTQVQFPKLTAGETVKELPAGIGEKSSLIRLTFFLDQEIDYEKMLSLRFIALALQEKMCLWFNNTYKKDFGIEVNHHLSTYPHLKGSWMTIQLRCDSEKVYSIKNSLLNELKKLGKNGMTKQDIKKLKDKLCSEDEFWLRNNQYWLSTLMDYSTWQWDIKNHIGSYKEFSLLNDAQINKLLLKTSSSPYICATPKQK